MTKIKLGLVGVGKIAVDQHILQSLRQGFLILWRLSASAAQNCRGCAHSKASPICWPPCPSWRPCR